MLAPMEQKNLSYPLVKLPKRIDLVLSLIKEELKTRKFFDALQQAGLDDCYFQPHLDRLILKNLGMDDGTDGTFNLYSDIIEKRSKKIEADQDSIMKQALKVYIELIIAKKKRSSKS
jgi:hypothetical protein